MDVIKHKIKNMIKARDLKGEERSKHQNCSLAYSRQDKMCPQLTWHFYVRKSSRHYCLQVDTIGSCVEWSEIIPRVNIWNMMN